ncbi:MAG: hypothetical protein U1F51_08275 [Burkholderiales bacterium]
MVLVGGRETQPAVDGLRRGVGRLDLQVREPRPALPGAGEQPGDERAGEAAPPGVGRGDDVEQPDDIALAGAQARRQRAPTVDDESAAGIERRRGEPLSMRVAFGRRRSAQLARGLDEVVHRRLGDRATGRQRGGRRRPIQRRGLNERRLVRVEAAGAELGVERRRLRERRDAEQERQPALGVDTLAIGDLVGERERRAEVRVDAARPLRLSGREAQHPAVVEHLAPRLQRVQTRLLDASQVRHASIPIARPARTASAITASV